MITVILLYKHESFPLRFLYDKKRNKDENQASNPMKNTLREVTLKTQKPGVLVYFLIRKNPARALVKIN